MLKHANLGTERPRVLATLLAALLLPIFFTASGLYAQEKVGEGGMLLPAAELVMLPVLPGISLPTGSAGIYAAQLNRDFAGNRFDAYAQGVGNDTWVRVVKTSPEGVALDELIAEARGPEGQVLKINSAASIISGDDLVVEATAYELTSPTRRHFPVSVVWEGIAVPYPAEVNPRSGIGPNIYTGYQQEPACEPVNYGTIREIVREELAAVVSRLEANLPSRTVSGVENLFSPDLSGSWKVWAQLRNTSYQGASEALLRFYPTPSPSPTPGPGP